MTFGNLLVASLLGAIPLIPAGCSRAKDSPAPTEAPAAPIDACALLTNEELERIMGARPVKSLPSENTGGGFGNTQCRFEMAAANDSISITVTHRAPGAQGRDPKAFLEERIEDYERREGDREKGEENKGLDFVPGLADKALWMGTMVGGNLYVLKDHVLICVAIGSSKDPATRKEKTVEIARLIVGRL